MDLADLELQKFAPPAAGVLDALPEGFRNVEPFPTSGALPSFLSGDPESLAIRVRYFFREEDRSLLARAWIGPGAKGPPGHAHGGSVAALLDEAMAICAWQAGFPVLAAKIQVDYRRPLPLGSLVVVDAWILKQEGPKLSIQSRMVGSEGEIYSEGEGLFVELNEEQWEAFEAYRSELSD